MMRLGVVPYLNALPLYHTLLLNTQINVTRAVPSQLAPVLSRGECDVALIPVVEHFRGVGEAIISDACIASSGAVRSVLLFHRVPLEDIQNVAVDSGSRTSVALLRIVLRDGFGLNPDFAEHAPDFHSMLRAHDAALLIGDSALTAAQNQAAQTQHSISILDLGAAWKEITGLPFVYAAWVARRGLSDNDKTEIAHLLNSARDEGLQHIENIARQYASRGILRETIASYLRENIEYSLTSAHRAGLNEFRRRCENLHLTAG